VTLIYLKRNRIKMSPDQETRRVNLGLRLMMLGEEISMTWTDFEDYDRAVDHAERAVAALKTLRDEIRGEHERNLQ
jgi:hypothetical protein